jgi:CTP synthase (UTP-ammonia lyase)
MQRIALVGDYSIEVPAHRAIPIALDLARREQAVAIEWTWIATRELNDPSAELDAFSALWVVPGSPYENFAGVLHAIRWARETKRPFLGTCGGFQHALIEIARNVLGLPDADHGEINPTGAQLVVTPLICSLVEVTGPLRFREGSRLRSIYDSETAEEGYRCRYGPSATYRDQFERAGLRFTAFDDAGEPWAAEFSVDIHPFFFGTLFQPERAALRGETPPLVRAFTRAATRFR